MISSLVSLLRLPTYLVVIAVAICGVVLDASSDRDMALPPVEGQLESLLSQRLGGAKVDLEGLNFRANLSQRELFIEASSLRIQGLGEAPDTVLENIGADFALPELIHGKVNPLSLSWGGVSFGIVADESGTLAFGLNPTPGAGQTGADDPLPFFLSQAYASAPGVTPNAHNRVQNPQPFTGAWFSDYTNFPWLVDAFDAFPEIETLELADVDLSYEDQRIGFAIKTVDAHFFATRDSTGRIRVEIDGRGATGTKDRGTGQWRFQDFPFDAKARLTSAGRVENLSLQSLTFVPARLTPMFPDNPFLASMSAASAINLGARFDASGALTSASGDIDGILSVPVVFTLEALAQTGWRLDLLGQNIKPRDEPYLLEHFDFLEMANGRFSGDSSILFDAFGELQLYQVNATLDQSGFVQMPDLWRRPMPVRGLSLSVQGDSTTADVLTQGGQVFANGVWSPLALDAAMVFSRRGMRMDLALATGESRLDAGTIASLYPDALEGDVVREWYLDNVRGGQVENASLSLKLESQGQDGALEIVDLKSRFDVVAGAVQITPGMGVGHLDRGRVRIDNDQVWVRGTQGSIGPLQGSDLDLHLDFADPRYGTAQIALDISGDAVAGARYLAGAGLGLEAMASALPLGQATGRAQGRFTAQVPMTDNEDWFNRAFDFEFEGSLSDFALRRFLVDQDIVGAHARLSSSLSRTIIDGRASVGRPDIGAGYDTQASYTLSYDHQAQDVDVRGRFDSTIAASRPFVGQLADYGQGAVRGQFTYRGTPSSGRGRADVVADLTQSQIEVPFLYFTKPRGRATSVSATVELENNAPTRVSRFQANADNVDASGRVLFYDQHAEQIDIALETLRFDGSQLSNVQLGFNGNRIDVAFQGGIVDASTAVEALFGQNQALRPVPAAIALGPERGGAVAQGRGLGLSPEQIIVVRAENVERVILPHGRFINDVTTSIVLQNDGVEHLRFRGLPQAVHTGRTPGTGYLTASISSQGQGFAFRLRTDDAGSAFYAANLNDNVRLGVVELDAYSPLAFPHGAWSGNLRARNLFLFNAPLFGQLFQVASLSGIGELLSGTGLGFSEVSAQFTYSPGKIHIGDWRMLGPSIGMTGQGGIDFEDQSIDVRGTVTPLGALNEVTQQVPLIGTLLNGLDGGGLFSATYSVKGSFARPDVFVNPWTGLTPGAFRDLYRAVTGSF